MVIFSEFRETGIFLYENMRKTYGDKVMCYSRKVLRILKKHIKDFMLENAPAGGYTGGKQEIILSEYME